MDLEPDGFDPIVTKPPIEVYSHFQVSTLIRAEEALQIRPGEIVETPPLLVRKLVEPEELRPLEINPDDGESPMGGGFTLPQPIMDRMPVDIPTPIERLQIGTRMAAIAQSTPTALPRGQQQSVQTTFRKPKVTFATTPFEERETVRPVQNDMTPRSGAQRRTIFEDDMFGTNHARKRTPSKADKHSALIGVRFLALIYRIKGPSGR
jgi:hypothetical protein